MPTAVFFISHATFDFMYKTDEECCVPKLPPHFPGNRT